MRAPCRCTGNRLKHGYLSCCIGTGTRLPLVLRAGHDSEAIDESEDAWRDRERTLTAARQS